jgi:TIR domain
MAGSGAPAGCQPKGDGVAEFPDDYDVFLSYARTDEQNHQFVSKLVSEMERQFQSQAGQPLRTFVDTKEIATAQLWDERIRGALEASTFMIAVLTPLYFTSEWCGREWDHFQEREVRWRREERLPSSDTLIFPIRFLSLDRVLWRREETVRERIHEANSRQAKDLVGIDPDGPDFSAAVEELVRHIIDTFIRLDELTAASASELTRAVEVRRRDAAIVSASVFSRASHRDPRITTRIGNQEDFVYRLSEASQVTIVGITNEHLTGFLEQALRRKRREHGPSEFWSSIRVVFADESLLRFVYDELDATFPSRAAAIDARLRQAGKGKRAVLSFFLRCDEPESWSMYEYPYLIPFVGALLEMPDGSKLVQVATLRPSYSVEKYLFIEFAEVAGDLAYYQAVFEEVVRRSTRHEEVTLIGVPDATGSGFLCRGSRFRRSVMVEGRGSPYDWLPAVIICTYWDGSDGAQLLLQIRTPANSSHDIGRLAHVSGFVNQEDCDELEPGAEAEFMLSESAARNAAVRKLREELELTEGVSELRLVDQIRYYSSQKESHYFYLYLLRLSAHRNQFPPESQIRPWALSDLLDFRRYQVLTQAERILREEGLPVRQARLTARALELNLSLHGLEELGARLSRQIGRQEFSHDLMEEVRRLRGQVAPTDLVPGQDRPIEGLGGLQYREFYSRLLPLYQRIGVLGAQEEMLRVAQDPTRRAALAELTKLYAHESETRLLSPEV